MNRLHSDSSQNHISTQSMNDLQALGYSQFSEGHRSQDNHLINILTHNQLSNAFSLSNNIQFSGENFSESNINIYSEEKEISKFRLISETEKKIFLQQYVNDLRNKYDLLNNPCLKISLTKLNALSNEKDFISEYYLTPYGLIGSERKADDYFLKIGRLLFESGEVQNDIILSADRSISRVHCRIEFGEGFKYIKRLPDEYNSVFMLNHPRLGRNINLNHLPSHLLMNILSYLHNKNQFFITDCGSILGTCIRLRYNKPYFFNRTQMYVIGSEITIEIKEIYQCDLYPKLFLDYIYEQKKCGALIIGLSNDYHEFLANSTPQQRNLVNLQFPSKTCLKIEIGNINANEASKSFFLFANEYLKEFKIGRVGNSEIVIHNTTISRDQARIGYCDVTYRWFILDGSLQKQSLNGTWLSLTNNTQRYNKQPSEKFPLSHGDEVKVSDYFLMVEEMNINKYIPDMFNLY